MKRFWISLTIFFISINTLAAILYTGVEPIDSGGGFFTFSPMIDCMIWGTIIVISGIIALLCYRKYRPTIPAIPSILHYPVGYLTTLAILSLVVLLIGSLQLLDEWSNFIYLPFYAYILFLCIAYPLLGYITGNKLNAKWMDILWGILIAIVLCSIGAALIRQINAQYITPMAESVPVSSYDQGYISKMMRTSLGGILGRINLPACVLMDTYEYTCFYTFGITHAIPRDIMIYLVCLCPPVLFTTGWVVSIIKKR